MMFYMKPTLVIVRDNICKWTKNTIVSLIIRNAHLLWLFDFVFLLYQNDICLYFVLEIIKTTNMSTKNHKIFVFPCAAIEKPVYLHIFCNRNRKYYEYGNKNAANIRSKPQYDSIIWQLAFPTRIGWEKPVFLCQERMASSSVQRGV